MLKVNTFEHGNKILEKILDGFVNVLFKYHEEMDEMKMPFCQSNLLNLNFRTIFQIFA
jgi:hypothetical protein